VGDIVVGVADALAHPLKPASASTAHIVSIATDKYFLFKMTSNLKTTSGSVPPAIYQALRRHLFVHTLI
jgi:hypothetical protein